GAAELPDAVFVEDTCVVLDEVAIVARPGAPSRRAEVTSMASLLEEYRPLRRIESPGTLDGGDVLRLGRVLFVGVSCRTNGEGADQLRALVAPFGYDVAPVPVAGCLHLKTAVTAVAESTLLVNPAWVEPRHFGVARVIEVHPTEAFAANALLLGE